MPRIPTVAPPSRAPASPWASAPEREAQREAKRDAVLSTAAQLFNERGFHATSLDDIAARLNVSKPTLYYYVKNKDDIVIQCVRRGLQTMVDGIEVSRSAGGSAIDQLMTCMSIYAHIVTMDFGMCVIRINDDELPAASRKEVRRLKAGIDNEFRRLVALGVADGSLAPCDPKMVAFLIAGALSWIGHWYLPDAGYTPDEIAQQFIATLRDGVLRKPGRDTPAAPQGPARSQSRRTTAPPAKASISAGAGTPGSRYRNRP